MEHTSTLYAARSSARPGPSARCRRRGSAAPSSPGPPCRNHEPRCSHEDERISNQRSTKLRIHSKTYGDKMNAETRHIIHNATTCGSHGDVDQINTGTRTTISTGHTKMLYLINLASFAGSKFSSAKQALAAIPIATVSLSCWFSRSLKSTSRRSS